MVIFAPELFIKNHLRATQVVRSEQVQSLWSGYGEIVRYQVSDTNHNSVILKSIHWASIPTHPRGWHSERSHQRKVRSYHVEANWYQHWAQRCSENTKVPSLLAHWRQDDVLYLLLEDLDQEGFPARHQQLDIEQACTVLDWLANFHAQFLQCTPSGLWPQGTYWHLETRPDEWLAMADGELKQAAHAIDQTLRSCPYQTIVHGDAKVANFCFSVDNRAVAAVDFQYVGQGIGVQDVAYFLGSCLSETQLKAHLEYLLAVYFDELARCLIAQGDSPDLAEAVTQEWYTLFPVAWADFHRFILGWCPTHVKNTAFSRHMTKRGLQAVLSLPHRD